jgi:PKD repeat protein
VHAYAAPGTYEVKLTAANDIGCTGAISRIVRVFQGIKSPAPVVRDFSVCLNETATISPGNGNSFKFYARLSSEQLVFTGASFRTGPITQDTIFYVTGNDFLTESDLVAVRISVSRPNAAFSSNAVRLDLREEETLQLTDASAGATGWLWDFGDGSTSREQNPVHAYAAPGTYEVKLLTRNSFGCTAEASQTVVVFRTAVEDLSKAVEVYPNPSDGNIFLRKDNGFVTETISLSVTDLLGRQILRKEISQPQKLSSLFLPAPGVYQVQITANGQTVVRRVWVR